MCSRNHRRTTRAERPKFHVDPTPGGRPDPSRGSHNFSHTHGTRRPSLSLRIVSHVAYRCAFSLTTINYYYGRRPVVRPSASPRRAARRECFLDGCGGRIHSLRRPASRSENDPPLPGLITLGVHTLQRYRQDVSGVCNTYLRTCLALIRPNQPRIHPATQHPKPTARSRAGFP